MILTAALALAAVIAVALTTVRYLQRRAVERAMPGRSPETAIPIENYADIDVAIRMQSCRCGGRLVVRGEGPSAHRGHPLRVTRLECRSCERERQLYFDLSTLRH
jgi:hypothetical protein